MQKTPLILAAVFGATAGIGCSPDPQVAQQPGQIDGSDALRGSVTHPAWSPDGRSIAFISNGEGVRTGRPINFEVYKAALDGSGVERLTTNRDFESDISWGPDGKEMLFMSFRDGNDEIYLMDVQGTTQRNLTNAPASDGGPSWSPDHRTVVFHSDRGGQERRLYLMNADGSNVRGLPHDPGPGHSPRWSPDGSAIAFVSNRDGNGEIYVVDANGANIRRLTEDPRENGYPRWQPGSRAVAHTAGDFTTDRWVVVLIDLDDGRSRVVVDSTDSGNVAWSPDGRSLIFGRYRTYGDDGGEDSRLYVLDLATQRVTPVVLQGW